MDMYNMLERSFVDVNLVLAKKRNAKTAYLNRSYGYMLSNTEKTFNYMMA